jgi:uncharacterized protein (TIGR00255 family)
MLINRGMVNALLTVSSNLCSSHHLANDMSVSQVLAWPGVIEVSQLDMEDLAKQACALFLDAVEQLSQARLVEGGALKAHIEGRLCDLSHEVNEAKALVAACAVETQKKLLQRLHTVQIEVPEGRIEQEIAIILARLDVNEELDRLRTHMEEVARILSQDKIAGRRLDFLMQELNREANTLSSKSESVQLTQRAVEMKVLIEQMREQIQNIE